MARNKNPFTDRQFRLLEAIRAKIQEITDPDPEVIRHDRYEFYTSQTKKWGKIIKIRFPPRTTEIKSELAESAGLYTEARREKLAEIRKSRGIKTARNTDAMLFEEEWNAIAFKLKKAMYITGLINFLFAVGDNPLAEPCRLMQEIVLTEYTNITTKKPPIHNENAETPQSKGFKPYIDELAECD
jgi:hypothetical protein